MPRVLVISSTDLSADLGRTVLWRSGIERAFASDEAAGCERARSWGPNLIVVDGTEREGAERTVRRLRGDAATRQTAIAVLSRTPFLADAGDFRRAGSNAVLPPETSPSVWDARLEELLSVPRRREAKIPVQLEPWSRAGGGVNAVEGRALNISVNGLLLEASGPLDIGQKLDLRFRLPGSDAELQTVGEVVRQADASRRGIRFLVLRGEARDAIGAFVEAETAASGVASGAPKTAPATQDEIWHTELRALETLRTAILESSVDSVLIMTHEGRIVDINRAAERTLGYRREELVGSTIAETIAPPSDGDPRRQFLTFGLATASPLLVGQRIEMTVVGADGREVPVELTTTATPVKGRPFFTAFLRDLTDANRAQRLEAAARRITDASAVAQGLDELCKAIHLLLTELMAVRSVTIALRDASSGELTVPYRAGAAEPEAIIAQSGKALIEHVLRTGRPHEAEPWFGVPLEKHGQSFGVVAIESGGPAGVLPDEDRRTLTLLSQPIAVALDRKQTETQIHYLAYHDALTGLPNRHLLLDRVQLGIAQASRDQNHLGVLLVDLDRFNVINDSLGHSAGDQVVKEAATRLSRHVRRGDTFARMGADEFAVVIRGLRNPPDAAKVAQILQGSLADPLEVGGRELFVTACVGISIFPDDGTDLETLLKNADTALHRAKEQGHDSFRLYDPSMNAEAVHRLKLEHGLRRALSRDELVTHYQPVVDLTTGEIVCVEALLRWRHPEQGILQPHDFISIAETTGMIRAIGSWGLKVACVQARAWQERGHPRLSVAVNLSARQLHHMDVVAEVATALREAGLSPEALELELTETSAMVDAEATIRTLDALKDLGVRISIDDFGIGYSSMSHLQKLPIDMLKIDRSFVRDITTDADDAAIVLAIINLGHTLKLKIVAEGVETAEQLEFLARHGCDRIQGYLFAQPVPAAECAGLLTAHRAESWRRPPGRTSGH